jgi:ADYC domain
MSLLRTLSPALALLGGLSMGSPAHGAEGRLRIDGADLVLTLDDGRVLRRQDLIGLSLTMADGASEATIRIDGFEEDRTLLSEPLPTYRVSVLGPGGERTRDLCEPDPKGRRTVLAYPRDAEGGFHLTCTSGAEGKCLLFGYRPWLEQEGRPMRDLFLACVHMLRADYGGDDRPATYNGTIIHLYDRFGIQKPSHAEGMALEAAWGAEGALCVAHPRFADLASLDELGRRVPRLQGRLGPQACSEEAMRADPRVLIFNESVPP